MSRAANSLSSKGQRLVESYAEFILECYPDAEEFTLSGRVDALPTAEVSTAGPHRQLHRAGCVRVVGERQAPNELGGDNPVNVYTIPDHVAERAREYLEGAWTPCPCGHRGVEHYVDGFECGWVRCDRLFSRAEVDG